MDNHFVGKGQSGGEVSATQDTSLVVRLFMDIVLGRTAVHVPCNEFQTVAVKVEEHYCLKCYKEGFWDIWSGRQEELCFTLGRCRFCGAEKTL